MKHRISLAPEYVRVLKSPTDIAVKTVYAYVPLLGLPEKLPLSPNPRVPKPNAVVIRIKTSLEEENGMFHILNRGITISARSADYDNSQQILTVDIPEGEDGQGQDDAYGILDGGHTYFSILKVLDKYRRDDKASGQFVKIEILTNAEAHLNAIAGARNFSRAVKEMSLKNHLAKLDWVKNALGDVAGLLRWRENDDEAVDAIEYLQVFCAFNLDRYDAKTHPLESYKNAAKCLDMIAEDPDEKDGIAMRRLVGILPDIARLYDTVRYEWWEMYRLPGDDGKFGRPGRLVEVKMRKGGKGRLLQYPALGKTKEETETRYHVEKGLVIPAIAAFRVLLEGTEHGVRWKTDPFSFWSQHGREIVRKTMEASEQRDRNPHLVGRDKTVYEALYEAVELLYLRNRQ